MDNERCPMLLLIPYRHDFDRKYTKHKTVDVAAALYGAWVV